MSDSNVDVNGEIVEGAQVSTLVAAEPVADHVGTPTATFTFIYQGQTLSYVNGVPCVADPNLYAQLNAANAPITWTT